MAEAQEKKQPAAPQLDGQRFKLAEHERNVHIITTEAGVTRAQILDPAFLAHVAAKLRPYDQIEVRSDDGTIFARLLVLQAERTWATAYVLEWHDLTTKDVALTQSAGAVAAGIQLKTEERYKVEWKGPHLKGCVVDYGSNPPRMVREKEPSKDAAALWLREWLKVTA
jgi:hypothetical protein